MKTFLATTALVTMSLLQSAAQPIARWKADDLVQYAAASDSFLVINFWATVCVPCVAELPYFHSVTNRYRHQKVKLLLVSMDFDDFYPDRIRSFANKRNYTAEIVWLDEEKPDAFIPKIDTAWSGSIPATLFVHRPSGYRKFVEGSISETELEKLIQEMLKANKPTLQ
jgi:thiol-disulfide isomerase/thioredoxin